MGEVLRKHSAAVLVELQDRRGALELDLAFTFRDGWTVLFGPSGSGKSTVLRMIAGLERPLAGRVVIGGETVLDVGRGVFMAAHRRGVRMVAQRPGLFPERTVRSNLNFGAESESRVKEVARLCRVERLMDRGVGELSGGERQRVALARSLATGGMRCLLLDEPFTGLDGRLRDDLLTEVQAWLEPRGVPVLLVTHDVGEVFASEGRVIRMRAGRVVTEGTAQKVLEEELTALRRRLEVGVERG